MIISPGREAAVSQRNKDIIRRLREQIIPSGDLSQLDTLYTDDYVYHGIPSIGDLTGANAFKQLIAGFLAGIPDLRETVVDQIAEGDKVATRLRGTGTHLGNLMGVPGSGKRMNWTAIVISRFAGEKIAEEWIEFDALSFSQQLRPQ
jgi:steroid delta-isomerase-like uncharacterized protein